MLKNKFILRILIVSLCVCVCGAVLSACKDEKTHNKKATFDEAESETVFSATEPTDIVTETISQDEQTDSVEDTSGINSKEDSLGAGDGDDSSDTDISIVTGSDSDKSSRSSKSAVNSNEGSSDSSKKSVGDFPEYNDRKMTMQDYVHSDLLQKRLKTMRSAIDPKQWELTCYTDDTNAFVFSYKYLFRTNDDDCKAEFNNVISSYVSDIDSIIDEIKNYISVNKCVVKFRAQSYFGNVVSEKMYMR